MAATPVPALALCSVKNGKEKKFETNNKEKGRKKKKKKERQKKKLLISIQLNVLIN